VQNLSFVTKMQVTFSFSEETDVPIDSFCTQVNNAKSKDRKSNLNFRLQPFSSLLFVGN